MPRLMMSSLSRKIEAIKKDIICVVESHANERFWVTHYGATNIDPKYLVIWICVQSDAEKQRLIADHALNTKLRMLLERHEYPREARKHIHIGFESQDTVDREANGNWWYHWK